MADQLEAEAALRSRCVGLLSLCVAPIYNKRALDFTVGRQACDSRMIIIIIIVVAHRSQTASAHHDSCLSLSRACVLHHPPPPNLGQRAEWVSRLILLQPCVAQDRTRTAFSQARLQS